MEKQIILAISREFGSGGHEIAEKLSKKLSLPMYDKNILREIEFQKGAEAKSLAEYDEVPKSKFFSRTVREYSSSPEEAVAQMQFDFLKKKAQSGESFIIVGRCAEDVLKGHEGLITIFVLADTDWKIKRVADYNDISESEAKSVISRNNKKRKQYHNYYCDGKWGDSRNYDMSINSSRLGINDTVEMITHYVKKRMGKK